MSANQVIYFGTVCLERNRWGSRQPSFRVSEWLPRFRADGFDGVELWENHFLAADPAEQALLVERAAPVAVFNSYAGFADGPAETEQRAGAAKAIRRLRAAAVKYNVGADPARLAEYRRNLLAWAEALPPACRLLCECHGGTVLESLAAAVAFFADLDPARFGVIVHAGDDPAPVTDWLAALPGRVQHVHLQWRDAAKDPAAPGCRARLRACWAAIRARGFTGTATLEFTRGIGRDEQLETLYTNARADLAAYRDAWQTRKAE